MLTIPLALFPLLPRLLYPWTSMIIFLQVSNLLNRNDQRNNWLLSSVGGPLDVTEVWPNNPHYTKNEKFFADKSKDKDETENCNKIYPEAKGMTGGLAHITCHHGITKGYSAYPKGEGQGLFTKPLMKRLPKRVKAAKRVFIYDNNCNTYKYLMRRYPWRCRRWTFVIDRVHFKNHKNCSSAFTIWILTSG